MIAFTDYAKVKDNYCICYFGYSDEYLVQLRLLKPIFEREFPGLKIHIGCKDDKVHLLGNVEFVLKVSDLKIRKQDFAHIRELRFNNKSHPIEDLLLENSIKNYQVTTGNSVKTTKAVLITKSTYPTKPLEKRQIEIIRKLIKERGFDIEFDSSIDNSGLVVGVESPELFEAAARGIETILVPTGVGLRLYKGLFPNSEAVHI